jgi:predicted transcriptional regulator
VGSALSQLKALASETRLAILDLIGEHLLNVNEVADELELAQPTVSAHVQQLEEAGLLVADFQAGTRGAQKILSRRYDRVILRFPFDRVPEEATSAEVSVPVGTYTAIEAAPTCGLASERGLIGLMDDPATFHSPERVAARLLWFAKGHVEYAVPNPVPPGAAVTSLELSSEICSEVAGFANEWPSDLGLWINGVFLGSWTCPGDFGGERGRLNPAWWPDRYTQFGLLKVWSVTSTGSYLDGLRLSRVAVNDLGLDRSAVVKVRIGNPPGAPNQGGLTLFGESFGNYAQDLVLRTTYVAAATTARVRTVAVQGSRTEREVRR